MQYLSRGGWLSIALSLTILTACQQPEDTSMNDILRTGTPTTDLQILYSGEHQDYADHIKDETTRLVIQCRNEIDATTYSVTLDSAMANYASEGLPSNPLDHEIALLYLKQHLSNPHEIDKRLNFINDVRAGLDKRDVLDRYYDLYYHSIQAEQLYEQGRNLIALTYAYEGLYQLSQAKNKNLKPLLWDRLISTAINIGSREENSKPYQAQNRNLNSLRLDTTSIKKRLTDIYINEDDVSAQENLSSRIAALSELLERTDSRLDSTYISLSIGVYHEINGDRARALRHYHQAATLYPPDACCHRCKLASDFAVDLGSQPLFKLDASCPDYLSFNFSSLSVKTLDDILNQRQVANEVFGGRSSLHLQDFYLDNTLSILEHIHEAEHADSLLINIFADTRSRERYRQLSAWNTTSSLKATEIYGEINNALIDNKSFTAVLPPDDPSYHELYVLIERLESAGDRAVTAPPVMDQASIAALSKYDNLYNVLQIGDSFHFYTETGSGLKVAELPAKQWSNLSNMLLNAIVNQGENLDTLVDATKQLLEAHGWQLDRPLTLIADGSMLTYPWELLTDHDVSRFTDVDHLLYADRQSITSYALCSFSDDETLKSRAQRTYVELAASQTEVKQIAALLDDPNMVTGYDLTSSSLDQVMHSDLVHIATHGIASSDNRLDNYLVVRDEEGNGIPYYAYRFAQAEYLPKVAILSTCYSGTGTYVPGAGVFSLAKVLQAAGCQSVIKSLWAVDDTVTKELMIKLYQHWSTGISLTTALHLAKMDIKASTTTQHPYYWAGFVLEGNGQMYLSSLGI